MKHEITRQVRGVVIGEQVTLTCRCGRWSAMTVAYGPYTVTRCTESLLSDRDGIHIRAAYVGDAA